MVQGATIRFDDQPAFINKPMEIDTDVTVVTIRNGSRRLVLRDDLKGTLYMIESFVE